MLADLIVMFEMMAFGVLEMVVSEVFKVHEYLQSIF